MLSNEFDLKEIEATETYMVMKYKDSIYKGQTETFGSRKRSGYGIVVYTSGRVYEG